jgi:hypothetical protein
LQSDPDHVKNGFAGASFHDLRKLNIAEFVALLKERGIEIQERGGRLAVSAASGTVDDVLRAELQRRKADLLARLTAAKGFPHKSPLLPGKRSARIPLTMSQQGMWLIDHFDPGNVAYNIPEAFSSGPLDLAVVQRTADLLVARHEVFRTGIHEQDGELYQSIEPQAHSPSL